MGDYTGVHTFLFVNWNGDPEGRINAIAERSGSIAEMEGELHFASITEEQSDFGGFAHLSAPTTRRMGELIDDHLWNAGIHSDYETEGVVYTNSSNQQLGPKRRSPRYSAICRVRVRDTYRPIGLLQEIGNGTPGFFGGSQLLRRSRLLIELADDDRTTLEEHVAALRRVRGVYEVIVGIIDTTKAAVKPSQQMG